MKDCTRRLFNCIGVLVLLGLLAACAPPPAAPPSATPPAPVAPLATATAKPAAAVTAVPTSPPTPRPLTKVRFGHTGLLSDVGAYIGLDKGYFKEQGIDLELTMFSKTQDIIPALSAAQIEISGNSTTPALFNAILRGFPLKIVADKSACPSPQWGARALVIRKDLLDSGQYKGIKDLKGKTIAYVAALIVDELILEDLLGKEGLTLKDMNPTFLDSPSTVTALGNKAIDGAFVGEPTLSQILEMGTALKVVSCEVVPELQHAQILYAPQFYKDTDLASRFMVGYVRALRDYNDAFGKGKNLDDVIRILTTYTLIKDPATYKKMAPAYLNPDGYVNQDGYTRMLKWFVDKAAIDKMPDMKTIVDNQYVDYAIKVLGKYNK